MYQRKRPHTRVVSGALVQWSSSTRLADVPQSLSGVHLAHVL
jgi:hypothetical protein